MFKMNLKVMKKLQSLNSKIKRIKLKMNMKRIFNKIFKILNKFKKESKILNNLESKNKICKTNSKFCNNN